MKTSVVLILVFGLSIVASAYPQGIFLDLPAAVTLGDPGYTSLQLELAGSQPTLRIGRAVGSRVDVLATITPQDLFSLGVRVLLIEDLGPLNVTLGLEHEKVSFAAGLFLGPVWIDWGRAIGRQDRRWGMVIVSPKQSFSLILGLEHSSTSISFIGGIRLFLTSGFWEGSILFREGRLIASLGGIF
jgi:hypothetical protein